MCFSWYWEVIFRFVKLVDAFPFGFFFTQKLKIPEQILDLEL